MPLLPGSHLIDNYQQALSSGSTMGASAPVSRMMFNSLVMAVVIAVGKIAISIIASFAIVYFRFPLRNFFFWMIFVTLMLPVEVRIIPTFKVVSDLGMVNTYMGLTVPLIASATATFLFRQFFLTYRGTGRRPPASTAPARCASSGTWLLPCRRPPWPPCRDPVHHGWNQYLWPMLITSQESMLHHRHRHQAHDHDRRRRDGMEPGDGHRDAGDAAARAGGVLMQRWFVKGLVETEKIMAAVSLKDGAKLHRRAAGDPRREPWRSPTANSSSSSAPRAAASPTLLRMVAGLETITGRARSSSAGTWCNQAWCPRTATFADGVPELLRFTSHMSRLRQHGRMGLRIKGFAQEGDPKRSASNAGRGFSSQKFLDRKAGARCSGGQRQRVGHGAAPSCASPGVPVRRAALEPRTQAARADRGASCSRCTGAWATTSLFVTARPGRGDDASPSA
jgi:sn-glycerol 3-phosphate transport system permease protein